MKCFLLTSLVAVTAGCAAEREATRQIQAGQTKEEVTASAGDPDEVKEFILPNEPFFGPQEGLAGLLPAGTLVEEWLYHSQGEVTYVWFVGEETEPREEWKVIDTAIYPDDAVY
jgi:hypothetical protein